MDKYDRTDIGHRRCPELGADWLFNFDLVTALFNGNLYWLARVIFALVGVAGAWCLTLYHAVGEEDQMRMSKQ